MRRITFGLGNMEKKNASPVKNYQHKEQICRGCDRKSHIQKKCRETVCAITVKSRGIEKRSVRSWRERSERRCQLPRCLQPSLPGQPTTAAVTQQVQDKFFRSGPITTITRINNRSCDLRALVDTGSSVSFIAIRNLDRFFYLKVDSLDRVH